ncbi:MAG: hypothetical protein KDN05_17470 [Verrucomicrobiae bacterium]|nr:hypothetical protein [Verrucomicrobiae bacterium]
MRIISPFEPFHTLPYCCSGHQGDPRLNVKKQRILSEEELLHWQAERNRHFAILSGRRLAVGKIRFRIKRPERTEEAA